MNGDWRDKDDLDLTADDLGEMLVSGKTVEVRGPRLPANAILVSVAATKTVSATIFGGTGLRAVGTTQLTTSGA